MAKVSVIIPVYNVEKYLRECLDSVRKQTLEDLEIICVDDGSTDSSGKILDDYAKRDRRIHVLHKANEGYGKAMNTGIKIATAPYVGIVESDDRIASDMYEFLVRLIEEMKTDVVKADFYEFYDNEEGAYIEEYVKLIPSEALQDLYGKVFRIRENKEAFRSCLATWSGVYSRDFLLRADVLYNETPGASYQDQGFWLQTMIKAERIYFADKAFYYYRIDNYGSSMYDKGKVFDVRNEYRYMRELLESTGAAGVEYYPWLNFLKISSCLNSMSRVADTYKESLAECIRKDIWEAAESGELDADLFDTGLRAELFSLIASPKAFSEGVIKKRKRLEHVLEGYDRIILYGAGKIGRMVQSALKEGRLNTKIKSFAVTEKESNPPSLSGIPVREIQELVEYREQALVIICVGKKYISEINMLLKKKGFKNCMTYKGLLYE